MTHGQWFQWCPGIEFSVHNITVITVKVQNLFKSKIGAMVSLVNLSPDEHPSLLPPHLQIPIHPLPAIFNHSHPSVGKNPRPIETHGSP